jgi:hypothetical protein
VDGHCETYSIRSRGFKRWLLKPYFEQQNASPNSESLGAAINMLAAFAHFEGEERKTFVRVAGHSAKLYLDLCNPQWQIVEIDVGGWRIIESKDCPMRFWRAHGMQALPAPEGGGSIGELRQFVNVATDADFQLLVAALVSYYRARGPYPVLIFSGEQGTAKSTNTTVLRLLIDPNAALLRSEPKEPRDLMIAANNGWILALNNLSNIPVWLSDALCRLATGGGFSTRELYSDSDEVIFDAQRPVILNGIEELATRGDLLDRSIILELPRIAENKRLTEEDFYQRFYEARPRILGALLDGISGALRRIDSVKLDKLPRMADFAKWVVAAEVGLGWQPGSFMAAYAENREAAHGLALESSPVAAIIKEHLGLPFEGTATELLSALDKLVDEKTRNLKSWPKSPKSLANGLRRLAPNLAAVGIDVDFIRDKTKSRRRTISIRPTSEGKTSSESSDDSEKQAKSDTFRPDSSDATSDANLNAADAHRPMHAASDATEGVSDAGSQDDRPKKNAAKSIVLDDADDSDAEIPILEDGPELFGPPETRTQLCPYDGTTQCPVSDECDVASPIVGCRQLRTPKRESTPESDEERAYIDRLAAADASDEPGITESDMESAGVDQRPTQAAADAAAGVPGDADASNAISDDAPDEERFDFSDDEDPECERFE